MVYTINKSGNYGIITPIPIGSLANTLDKYLQYERQGKQFMPNPFWAIVHLSPAEELIAKMKGVKR